MSSLIILLGRLLDALSLKSWSDAIFARFSGPSDADYPVHRAIWAMCQEGRYEDARRLASSRWEWAKSLRIGRDFIHVLLRLKQPLRAIEVADEMAAQDPRNPWTQILAADLYRFFGDNEDKALVLYLDAVPACEAMLPYHYAMAVVYKRLTSIYRRRGDAANLAAALDRFLSVSPSNFRDDEFIELAEIKLKQGDREGAKKVFETSFVALTRCLTVREAYERMGFGDAPPVPPRKNPLPTITGVSRITIKTDLLTEVDGPVETLQRWAGDKTLPGDTVTLSSCVGAIMEGRMLMEGTVPISFVARFASRYIAGAHRIGAFKSSAPMANPLSAQTAVEEVGTLRLLVAAAAGMLGKLFKIDGWFYVVSGAQVAQIDDILGSVPPYDYYVMMGPRDSSALSNKIAAGLGEGVHAAIIDANDLGIAWAVGYSRGVDAKWLELAMSDNPAGNQEQMTPVVIVRPDKERRAEVAEGTKESLQPEQASQSLEEFRGNAVLKATGTAMAWTAAAFSVGAAAARTYAKSAVTSPRARGVIAVVLLTVILGGSALAWADRRVTLDVPVPVLLYHEITADAVSPKGMIVPLHEFREQMMLLLDSGYTAITAGQLQSHLAGRGTMPSRPVLITFDDGYESVYTLAYPVLRDLGLRATAFVVGTTLRTPNHMTFEQIREMTASGIIEVASHTYAGHGGTADAPDIRSWTEDDVIADLSTLTAVLRAEKVPMAPAFAYPFGDPSAALESAVNKAGFTIAFTTENGMASRTVSLLRQRRITVWPGSDGALFLRMLEPSYWLDDAAHDRSGGS